MNRFIDNYFTRSSNPSTASTTTTNESNIISPSASKEYKLQNSSTLKVTMDTNQENETIKNVFEKNVDELLNQTSTKSILSDPKYLSKKYFSESNINDVHNYSKNFNRMNSREEVIKGSKDIIEKIIFTKPKKNYEQFLNDNNVIMTKEEISLLRTKSTTLSYNDYLAKYVRKINKVPKPPLLYKPWSIVYELDQPPRVKDEELINKRIKKSTEINEIFNNFQSSVVSRREENKKMRSQEKQLQMDRLVDKRYMDEQIHKVDLERRKIYKSNLLEELKLLKIQIEQEKQLQATIKSIQESPSFLADTDY